MRLWGRVALVNEISFGIGQDVAEEMAREGADVVIPFYRNGDGAYDAVRRVQALGRRALAVQTDPDDPGAIASLFDAMEAEIGPPEILVNTGWTGGGTDSADPRDALPYARPFLRARRREGGGGRILTVTRSCAASARPDVAAAVAIRARLDDLVRTLALEVAPDRITVNGIFAGLMLSPVNQDAIDDRRVLAEKVRHIPLGRAGEPREVADVAVFLASTLAGYITGQSFAVDGGLGLTLGRTPARA